MQGYKLACDTLGSVYLVGVEMTGTNQVNCVIKFDSTGQVLWSDTTGDVGLYEPFTSVTVDPQNNAILNGYFTQGPLVFGADTLVSQPTAATTNFTVKYAPGGQVLWANCLTTNASAGYTTREPIATDAYGNFYETYTNSDTMHIDTLSINWPAAQSWYAALVKYNSDGRALWALPMTTTGTYGGGPFSFNDIAADSAGNVYLAGYYSDSLTMDSLTLLSPPNSTFHGFFAKISPQGHLLWAQVATDPNNEQNLCYGVAIATDGTLYVSGGFFDSLIIDGNVIINSAPSCPYINKRGFVASFDPVTSHLLCAATFPFGGHPDNYLAPGPDGSVYFGGTYCSTSNVIGMDTLSALPFAFFRPFVSKFTYGIASGIKTIKQNSPTLSLYPNPAIDATNVSFTLPDGSTDASLHITDILGNEIKSYAIQNSQKEMQVDVHSISSGIYLVSLIANGRTVATQKMVLE